jgi:hypothetical protein
MIHLWLTCILIFFSSLLLSENQLYGQEQRILFVGNSLTYTNDLPKLVAEIAQKNGKTIVVETLAFPDYALIDHWNDGNIRTKIASGKYDFIVVQQGPSSQEDGRKILLEYGEKLSKLCSKKQTQLVFYMVWPSIANYKSFEGVIQNYSDAAKLTNAILCPVGKGWKEYIDKTKDYSYYGPDGFHPSLKGSQIAAEIIYNSIFN